MIYFKFLPEDYVIQFNTYFAFFDKNGKIESIENEKIVVDFCNMGHKYIETIIKEHLKLMNLDTLSEEYLLKIQKIISVLDRFHSLTLFNKLKLITRLFAITYHQKAIVYESLSYEDYEDMSIEELEELLIKTKSVGSILNLKLTFSPNAKHATKYIEFLKSALELKKYNQKINSIVNLELNPVNGNLPVQTKTEILNGYLLKYGFYEVPLIKALLPEKQTMLVELMSSKGIPYSIAMFDYIEYFKLLDKEYFKNISQRNISIAKWFNTDARSIRGNKNVLDKGSDENEKRYTSHKHKESVINDYNQLK